MDSTIIEEQTNMTYEAIDYNLSSYQSRIRKYLQYALKLREENPTIRYFTFENGMFLLDIGEIKGIFTVSRFENPEKEYEVFMGKYNIINEYIDYFELNVSPNYKTIGVLQIEKTHDTSGNKIIMIHGPSSSVLSCSLDDINFQDF